MYSNIGLIQPTIADYSIVTDYGVDSGTLAPGTGIDVAPTPVLPLDLSPDAAVDVAPTGTTSTTGTPGLVYLYLYFKDKKTGQPIEVNGKLIDLATGNVLSEIQNSSEAEIKVEDVPLQQLGVQFYKTGYKKIVSTADQLQLLPQPRTIFFEKGDGVTILYTAAALAALLFFYYKTKKKVGAFDKKKAIDITAVVALGIAVYLAYKLVKKILDFLGVTKSQATASLDDAATNPNSFWNPNYWKDVKPANASYSYAFTWDQAAALAGKLYDAFGAFNDDEEQAINVFKQCRTKANASYICYVFQFIYGEDCLKFLRGGWWPQDRLSDADVYEINQYVNNLKDY